MNVIILVLSFNDNGGYFSRFHESQKLTWDSIPVDNVKTFYYFGNHNKNEILDNIIYTTDIEDYKCTKKTITALKMINNIDFDFVVRTNSSSYIDKKMIYNFLLNKPKENYYGGIVGTCDNLEFASGACFVLSKNIVSLISENYSKIDYDLIDDVAISKLLTNFNVYPVNDGYTRFNYSKQEINDINFDMFFHYRLCSNKTDRKRDIEMMYKIHDKKYGINHW